MRPIIRGDIPTENAIPITFAHYGKALPHLVRRIGLYCSYCGKRIENSPAIEHICPKSVDPSLELDWNNFLLACKNCNSIKHVHPDNINESKKDYFWPDEDDTFNIFTYEYSGKINVKNSIPPEIKEKAKKTLELTGLNRYDRGDEIPLKRREAWGVATESLSDLKKCETEEMKRQIIRTAVSRGYWSVWMTVFRNENNILKSLIDLFPGTNTKYFSYIYQDNLLSKTENSEKLINLANRFQIPNEQSSFHE